MFLSLARTPNNDSRMATARRENFIGSSRSRISDRQIVRSAASRSTGIERCSARARFAPDLICMRSNAPARLKYKFLHRSAGWQKGSPDERVARSLDLARRYSAIAASNYSFRRQCIDMARFMKDV